MISFDGFELTDGTPIYLQILLHIKRGVVSGAVWDGDELPSRRALSALLGVNPNTIQKAYRILEDEGLIESRAGAKSCMRVDHGTKERVRASLVESEVLRAISALKEMGLSAEQATELLKKHWNDETGGETDSEKIVF